jgi:hypothetical protein
MAEPMVMMILTLSNKSKETKALWVYENGKRPTDVAIKLDILYSEVVVNIRQGTKSEIDFKSNILVHITVMPITYDF